MRRTAWAVAALAVLAGCGGGGAAAPDESEGKVIIAALGDSITAGSPLWDPDPAVREGIAEPDETSQFEYWATKENGLLEFRNCGVFGERTDEIAQRLDECAEGAEVLIIQGGINDIAQGRPVKDAAAELEAMVRRGKELGLETYLVDVLPWNNGQPAADLLIQQLNREIAAIGDDTRVVVIPFHDILEDPGKDGAMRATWTDDGDHPSIDGYRLLGERVAAVLAGEQAFIE